MKKLRVILLLLSVMSGTWVASAQVGEPQTDYEKAVRAYVDATTDELRAIRGQVDSQVAAINDGSAKAKYEGVFAKLDHCEKLLVQLKKSGPNNFDKIKARLEEARADLSKSVAAAKTD